MTQHPRSSVVTLQLMVAALIAIPLLAGSSASAQGFPVADWKADSIRSAVLNETRQISIALPVGYDFKVMADERYPVLLLLDERLGGRVATSQIMTARILSDMAGWLIPPMIIVTVDGGAMKVRDMTPPPVLGQPSPRSGRGGAPAFATFIADELLPWLASRYRTSPYTIVQGHSINGLFAAWVYGQRPDKIDAVLALSPTIMWSNEAYQQVLDGIRARTRPGHFFIAAGESEGTMIPGKVRQLLSDLARSPIPSTRLLHQWYQEVSHSQVDLLGFTDGLRAIFGPVGLAGSGGSMSTSATFRADFARRRAAYVRAAPQFGMPPRLPFFFTLNAALTLATDEYKGLQGEIPTLCDDLRASYPESWGPPLCDGFARLTQRQCERAAEAFSETLRIAQLKEDPIGIAQARRGVSRVNGARQELGCA